MNYQPPATPFAEAIQYPMDANWPERIINAYAKMARASRMRGLEQNGEKK